jgi:hypothetical protein
MNHAICYVTTATSSGAITSGRPILADQIKNGDSNIVTSHFQQELYPHGFR